MFEEKEVEENPVYGDFVCCVDDRIHEKILQSAAKSPGPAAIIWHLNNNVNHIYIFS